jgi:protease-4
MKRGTHILIIFLIFFVLIIAAFASLLFFEMSKPVAVKHNTYLEIPLSGPLEERPETDFVMSAFYGGEPLSLHDIWLNFQRAKADSKIKGIILRLGSLGCDWAKTNELRNLVMDFRQSGKKVFAYIQETLDFDKEYYLATACDRIILHPLGSLFINGIGGQIPFLKGTLDKLGIEVEVERVEEFKTAYNMFTEDGFTEHHREMMDSIYRSLFSQYIRTISQARGKDIKSMQDIIGQGVFHAEKAKELSLIDDLLYEDELEELLKDGRKTVHRIGHGQYLKSRAAPSGLNRGKKIALIYGVGPIHTGESIQGQSMGSSTVARWFRNARRDNSIAAVVFRVDSPGGSAVGSDIIDREVVLTKRQKPVIVSMSDMAGSGGYWISMDAHNIVAHPQTLTGSIGVIFGKFNFVKLYDKLGVSAEKLTLGQRADMFSTFRRLTPDERLLMKEQILWSYNHFITKVASGRQLAKDDVDEIGRGRVWTGSQAKEVGLIDELGGLPEALKLAKEKAGIPEGASVRLVVWPKKTSLWKSFFGKFQPKLNLSSDRILEKWIKTLQVLKKERILALMPLIASTN